MSHSEDSDDEMRELRLQYAPRELTHRFVIGSTIRYGQHFFIYRRKTKKDTGTRTVPVFGNAVLK